MILLAIVVRAGGEPPATQPDAFEPRYRTVARWTGTIKMRIRSYATREPGLFGLALSAPNNLEESTAQVSIREEADEVDGARRTVVESVTWSSKVSDLYYQNKDGSRVAAGPGGGGGGSYSEAELAGDPAPPSSNQDEFVAEKRQQIDEATRELARLESELAQARERARAWAEHATPQERAAEQAAEAALQAVLRAQTVDDDAAQSAAQDAYAKAEQARDELIRQRLGAAGDAFAREMEELAKVFQSGDQKRIAEATAKMDRLQKDYERRYGSAYESADAARQVRSLTQEISSQKLQLYRLRRHLWEESARREPLAQASVEYVRDPQTGRPVEASLSFRISDAGEEKGLMRFPVEVLPLVLERLSVKTGPQTETRQWESSAADVPTLRGRVAEDGAVELTHREDVQRGEAGLIGGGERKVEIVFTREAEPEPVELVVTPQDYEDWLPQAGEDVATPGNDITIVAELRAPGGGPPPVPAKRIRFELVDVSQEPGVALNWPPKDEPLDGRDFQFDQRRNPGVHVTHVENTKAQTPEGQTTTSATALVSAYDFGAFGKLRVTADLIDGRSVQGYLAGEPGRDLILLPKRRDDSRIADAWRQRAGAAQMTDTADEESASANDKNPGDGLSAYEEYRGFFVNCRHLRTDPRRKDLFLRDEIGDARTMGGIALFMWATDLEVHYELRRTELDESRVINVNRKSANRTDQHALILRKGEMPASWMGGQAVGGPGSPRDVTEVRIAPGMGGWWSSAKRKRDYGALVAHELLHAVNVFHHGDKDRGMVQWSRGTDSDGKPAILESPLDARGRPTGTGQPIRVFNENGTEYRPDAPQFKSPRKLWVSMPNGQHSGHDQCLMRYDCAQAYDAGVTALVLQRYVIGGDEPTGFELCATPDGTGVNAPARRPRPRHGKAATDRGGCVHQVLVSDEFPAVNRD